MLVEAILVAGAEKADEAIELVDEAVLEAGGEEANEGILEAGAEQANEAIELVIEARLEAREFFERRPHQNTQHGGTSVPQKSKTKRPCALILVVKCWISQGILEILKAI